MYRRTNVINRTLSSERFLRARLYLNTLYYTAGQRRCDTYSSDNIRDLGRALLNGRIVINGIDRRALLRYITHSDTPR